MIIETLIFSNFVFRTYHCIVFFRGVDEQFAHVQAKILDLVDGERVEAVILVAQSGAIGEPGAQRLAEESGEAYERVVGARAALAGQMRARHAQAWSRRVVVLVLDRSIHVTVDVSGHVVEEEAAVLHEVHEKLGDGRHLGEEAREVANNALVFVSALATVASVATAAVVVGEKHEDVLEFVELVERVGFVHRLRKRSGRVHFERKRDEMTECLLQAVTATAAAAARLHFDAELVEDVSGGRRRSSAFFVFALLLLVALAHVRPARVLDEIDAAFVDQLGLTQRVHLHAALHLLDLVEHGHLLEQGEQLVAHATIALQVREALLAATHEHAQRVGRAHLVDERGERGASVAQRTRQNRAVQARVHARR